MDLRKVTRNPGWWRLFIVLTGLWYGGWLVGGVVMFMFTAVIVLFPWLVFFNLRLMRYVIEGFIPERECLWITL